MHHPSVQSVPVWMDVCMNSTRVCMYTYMRARVCFVDHHCAKLVDVVCLLRRYQAMKNVLASIVNPTLSIRVNRLQSYWPALVEAVRGPSAHHRYVEATTSQGGDGIIIRCWCVFSVVPASAAPSFLRRPWRRSVVHSHHHYGCIIMTRHCYDHHH